MKTCLQKESKLRVVLITDHWRMITELENAVQNTSA